MKKFYLTIVLIALAFLFISSACSTLDCILNDHYYADGVIHPCAVAVH